MSFKKIKIFYFSGLCFLMLGLYGCACLTASQLKEVNAFGTLTKSFAAAPAKVLSAYNDAEVQKQLYFTNGMRNPTIRLQSLNQFYKNQQNKTALNKQADAAMQVLNDYGQKLAHLSADVHSKQLDTAVLAAGADLDNLISSYNTLVPAHKTPTGIGALVGQALAAAGDIYIRKKQADAVKMFVSKGDVLVTDIVAAIKDNLNDGSNGNKSVKDLIADERKDLDGNYLRFMKNDKEDIKLYAVDTLTNNSIPINILSEESNGWHLVSSDNGKQKGAPSKILSIELNDWRLGSFDADRLYLQCLTDLDTAEQLRQQCLTAADQLEAAHHQLLKDLQDKREIKDLYATLQSYASSVNQLYATYKKIK